MTIKNELILTRDEDALPEPTRLKLKQMMDDWKAEANEIKNGGLSNYHKILIRVMDDDRRSYMASLATTLVGTILLSVSVVFFYLYDAAFAECGCEPDKAWLYVGGTVLCGFFGMITGVGGLLAVFETSSKFNRSAKNVDEYENKTEK